MSTTKIRFKRGDTFIFYATLKNTSGAAIDLTGWAIKSQVRNANDSLMDEAVITVTSAVSGQYSIKISDTSAWVPNEIYSMDIQYTDPADSIISTETLYIAIIKDQTR